MINYDDSNFQTYYDKIDEETFSIRVADAYNWTFSTVYDVVDKNYTFEDLLDTTKFSA